jgi:hypothetical protein
MFVPMDCSENSWIETHLPIFGVSSEILQTGDGRYVSDYYCLLFRWVLKVTCLSLGTDTTFAFGKSGNVNL